MDTYRYSVVKQDVTTDETVTLDRFKTKADAISFAKYKSGGYYSNVFIIAAFDHGKRETVWQSKSRHTARYIWG